MKQIESISFNRVRNAEHYQFHSSILEVVTDAKAQELGIELYRTVYAQGFEKENDLFVSSRGFEETPEIVNADKLRDRIFSVVVGTVKTNLNETIDAKRIAAEKVSYVLKPFGNLAKKPMYEETALLVNLCAELKRTEMAPYVAELNLTQKVNELEEQNRRFITLFNSRQSSGRTDPRDFKLVRSQVDDAYNNMVLVINSMLVVNTTITPNPEKVAKVEPLIVGVNNHVRKLKEIYSLRSARTENNQDNIETQP